MTFRHVPFSFRTDHRSEGNSVSSVSGLSLETKTSFVCGWSTRGNPMFTSTPTLPDSSFFHAAPTLNHVLRPLPLSSTNITRKSGFLPAIIHPPLRDYLSQYGFLSARQGGE